MTEETSPASEDSMSSQNNVLHLESASKAFAAALESTDPVLQDTATRLSLSTQTLLSTYNSWAESMEDEDSTKSLKDALHRFRCVTSRIEIEMAAVAAPELDEEALRPIPVPIHRAARQLM